MIIDSYEIKSNFFKVKVVIEDTPNDFVPNYLLKTPTIGRATLSVLEDIKDELISKIRIVSSEFLDFKRTQEIRENFIKKAEELLFKKIPDADVKFIKVLTGMLVDDMLGLGIIETLLRDDSLEEIVVNGANDNIWVYHKKYGWLKTNIIVPSEIQIKNYADLVGRKVGRQINNLSPLMDAHMTSGDRINATLFPISSHGNTITIRRFSRSPWTITDFIENKSISLSLAAFLWMAIENETSMIVSGGTASGKTSLLNVLTPFIPPNQRIISIEDTRELQLPNFLHWVPMTTRQPNPEGKGEISMLDLLVNSLRMRPDRILVGEVRRQREAEILFEAMHTGHSVYATLHAETAEQTIRRLINPPINIPEGMIRTLPLVCVAFRHRKLGIRRILQVAEIVEDAYEKKSNKTKLNILYEWNAKTDKIRKKNESKRIFKELSLRSGMTRVEMKKNLKERQEVLKYLVKHNIRTVNDVGNLISKYYVMPEKVIELIRKNASPSEIFNAKKEIRRIRKLVVKREQQDKRKKSIKKEKTKTVRKHKK